MWYVHSQHGATSSSNRRASWFLVSVSPCRSDHLYVFFIQWSPDMYGEGVRGVGREPGFRVVKKNEESEKAAAEDEPVTDINVKEWEVSGDGSSITSTQPP